MKKFLFSICPHDTQKGLGFWYKFKEDLERALQEPINFEPMNSFEEEKEKLDTNKYHLYYASSTTAIHLYQKGYKPVAKIKGQKDEYYIIAKDESVLEKNRIRFATTFSQAMAYDAAMFLFKDVELLYVNNYEKVLELLLEDKADIGFIYETWGQIDEDKKNDIKILKVYDFSFYHVFMVHPDVYDKLKPVFLSFDFLEEVKDEDLLRFLEIYKKLSISLKRLEEHDIARAVLDSQNVGVIIYQDKIVFANEYTKNLFGYGEKELREKRIYDLVSEKYKDIIKNAMNRRLRGEFFNSSYEEIEVLTKDQKKRIIYTFSSTITFRGKPSGIKIFVDITKQKRLEAIHAVLREVNQAITLSSIEEEMLIKIAKALVDKFNLKLVWIGHPDEDTDYFKIDYKFGEGAGYLDKVKISYKEEFEEEKEPISTAYREDRIVIYSIEERSFNSWENIPREHGFKSSAIIPIKVDGKPKYVMGIHSEESYFFNEDILDVLKEIKSDIEFGIKKINESRESIIIKKIVDSSPSWVLITDDKFNIVYVNDAVSKTSLYEKEELIGKHLKIFDSGLNSKEFYDNFNRVVLNNEIFYGIFINKKKNSEIFYLDTTVYPVEIAPEVKRYIAIGRDITKETELVNEIAKLKHNDVLTGLLSLEGFKEEVSFHLKEDEMGFFVLIDIFNFTNINKVYGVDTGNRVLKEVAQRLKSVFKDAFLSRISADEFGMFKKALEDEKDLLLYASKIKDVFKEPVLIGDKELHMHFSAGVSFYPKDGKSFESLYENASVSLRYAKQKDEDVIEYFSKDIEIQIEKISTIQALIKRALRDELFVLYYQPFFDTKTLEIAGFEALVRIKDKDGTLYTPNTFIDFLEKSKYIFDFERWLIQKVSLKSKEWGLPISFNISARSFKNEEHTQYISSSEANAIIEITERILLEDPENVKRLLDHIKQKGNLKIAIDDFGTEYSSLKYIKDLPIDEIKIDISFVRSMMTNKKDLALVKLIIMMSKELGFKTLAEGVETKEQLETLKDMGCDYVQGFLLGKPMPEEEILKIFDKK